MQNTYNPIGMTDEYPKLKIQSCKIPTLDLEYLEKQFIPTTDELYHDYNPFHIQNIQQYNPIHSRFFELSEDDVFQISLNNKYRMKSLDCVVDNNDTRITLEKPVFIKFAPLLDPIRYMIGKYNADDATIRTLPTVPKSAESVVCHPKIANSNNSSYIDNFFSYLAGQMLHNHGIVHGVDYFGSFLGVQHKFKMNVTDDIEYLNSSTYFMKNIDTLYSVTKSDQDEFANFGSRNHKQKLCISDSVHPEEIDISEICLEPDTLEFEIDTVNAVSTDSLDDLQIESHELVYENGNANKSNKSTSSIGSSNNSESNYSLDSKEEGDDDDSEANWESDESSEDDQSSEENYDEDDEEFQYAFIRNFPVQMICLEKCEGTLDQLLSKGQLNEEQSAAALFQVIMTLLIYQRTFHFTHNDLHTNNIMYSETDDDYLYYRFQRITYKVPTYGKIFKLIDFGRSIYRFNGKLFCSDSFDIGGDAATQYNCEPYMNEDKPRIDPNYSFDLCRLGCSIYDFIIDNDTTDDLNDMQRLIKSWCTDDNGKNILYKKNGDERYPNFKLYKMIARNVHCKTPEEQLTVGIFKQFALDKDSEDEICGDIIDIDTLPCYA